MLVIGVSSTRPHDLNRLEGIGSNVHVLVADVRLNFLTSSAQVAAGSKHVKGHFVQEAVINAKLQSIFFNLVTKKVEKQRDGRSVESGIDGIAFL